MNTINTAPNTIPAATTKIIKDFGDGIVAAQHDNGYVGIFDAEEEPGSLIQISPTLIKSEKKSAIEIANEMMAA